MPDETTSETPFSGNSQAVQSHLTILQSVIERMGNNSASSKAWCITLVSAMLVIVADKGEPRYVWIALIPTVLFFALDAYYLALERGFRNAYNAFIRRLHGEALSVSDLFVVVPQGAQLRLFVQSLFSFSVLPFYLTVLAMIYAARALVI